MKVIYDSMNIESDSTYITLRDRLKIKTLCKNMYIFPYIHMYIFPYVYIWEKMYGREW
jgi:hypothetical protein